LAQTEKPFNSGDVMLACQLRGEDNGSAKEETIDKERVKMKDTPVFLELAPESGELMRVLVVDKGGVSLEFRFKNWNFDAAIPNTQFEFHPPPGVVILNGELPLQKDPVK
jgi:outer membrane lipoprotein-sorting protein